MRASVLARRWDLLRWEGRPVDGTFNGGGYRPWRRESGVPAEGRARRRRQVPKGSALWRGRRGARARGRAGRDKGRAGLDGREVQGRGRGPAAGLPAQGGGSRRRPRWPGGRRASSGMAPKAGGARTVRSRAPPRPSAAAGCGSSSARPATDRTASAAREPRGLSCSKSFTAKPFLSPLRRWLVPALDPQPPAPRPLRPAGPRRRPSSPPALALPSGAGARLPTRAPREGPTRTSHQPRARGLTPARHRAPRPPSPSAPPDRRALPSCDPPDAQITKVPAKDLFYYSSGPGASPRRPRHFFKSLEASAIAVTMRLRLLLISRQSSYEVFSTTHYLLRV